MLKLLVDESFLRWEPFLLDPYALIIGKQESVEKGWLKYEIGGWRKGEDKEMAYCNVVSLLYWSYHAKHRSGEDSLTGR